MTSVKIFNERLVFYSENQLITYSSGCQGVINLPELPIHEAKLTNNSIAAISCLCVSSDQRFLAASTEQKQLVIFDEGFSVSRNLIVNRIVSQMCFTSKNSLIVADKTGDVYLYDFNSKNIETVLLLGHLSVVLDVLLTNCGKYVITCDRDEKIRVSSFPNAYNIQCFCLGHSEFVIRLKQVGSMLVSASGDGTIRFWNYSNGEQVSILDTNQYIDDQLVREFCESMDNEDIEVSSLPITDMQIYERNNVLFIAVSLFKYEYLLLYSVDSQLLQVNSCKHIYIGEPFSFSLNDKLIILSGKNLLTFVVENNNYKDDLRETMIFSVKHNLSFGNDQNISVLYKKKFDNVGEYIEKKKARMDSK